MTRLQWVAGNAGSLCDSPKVDMALRESYLINSYQAGVATWLMLTEILVSV
jgi:hypothetical protein